MCRSSDAVYVCVFYRAQCCAQSCVQNHHILSSRWKNLLIVRLLRLVLNFARLLSRPIRHSKQTFPEKEVDFVGVEHH